MELAYRNTGKQLPWGNLAHLLGDPALARMMLRTRVYGLLKASTLSRIKSRVWPVPALPARASGTVYRNLLFFVATLLSSFTFAANAEPFFTLDETGWERIEASGGAPQEQGFAWRCIDCDSLVIFQVWRGPRLPRGVPSDKSFLSAIREMSDQQVVDNVLLPAVAREVGLTPRQARSLAEFGKLDLIEVGGREMLQAQVYIETSPATYELLAMAPIDRRMVKVTVNYFEGGLNETTGEALDRLFASLEF